MILEPSAVMPTASMKPPPRSPISTAPVSAVQRLTRPFSWTRITLPSSDTSHRVAVVFGRRIELPVSRVHLNVCRCPCASLNSPNAILPSGVQVVTRLDVDPGGATGSSPQGNSNGVWLRAAGAVKTAMTRDDVRALAVPGRFNVTGWQEWIKPVSYTHLTLPTIYSV